MGRHARKGEDPLQEPEYVVPAEPAPYREPEPPREPDFLDDPAPLEPVAPAKPVIERKVTASATATALTGLVVAILATLATNYDLVAALPLPPWLLLLLAALAPAGAALAAGYRAPHTPRPDLDATDQQ